MQQTSRSIFPSLSSVRRLVLLLGVGLGQVAGAAPTQPEAESTEAQIKQEQEVLKKREKRAQLTPITASVDDVTKPAFQLYVETDLPILGLTLVLQLGRLIKTQSAYCAPRCSAGDLNPIDRVTAGFYQPTWSLASDVAIFAVGGAAMALLMIDEGVWPAINDVVVIAESALAASAFAGLATLAVNRPRPFLYSDRAPLSVRNHPEGGLSFISGHSAVGFAIIVSTYIAMNRLHPKIGDPLPIISLAIGGAAMTFVTVGRVLGGNHFITDALAGVAIGTAFGILIPALHRAPVKVLPMASSQQVSITLLADF